MIRPFNYFQPTSIKFGCGIVQEVGNVVAKYGTRCVLVTVPAFNAIEPVFNKVKKSLLDVGINFAHFDQVIPNPTTDVVSAGADMAKAHGADVIIGIGGGSSIDTAKAIAVETTHKGTSWDYLFNRKTQPTDKTLPIVAVTTTAGTGSQVTQVAVITNPKERRKSAIYSSWIFPRVSIIDPELTLTVPEHITASTGFDVFAHAFEAYIHIKASPYVELLAIEAIRLVVRYLDKAVKDGLNLEARTVMSWADTLAGLCIANAGVTLPHGIGMAIGGNSPHVMHGEALAAIYPEFMRFTYSDAIHKFANLARIFNSDLIDIDDETAARESCTIIVDFLKKIGMYLSLETLNVSESELGEIADRSVELPDYTNNPRVATRDEIFEMIKNSYSYQWS
jgi:alcohol dehydrogenase class IV